MRRGETTTTIRRAPFSGVKRKGEDVIEELLKDVREAVKEETIGVRIAEIAVVIKDAHLEEMTEDAMNLLGL